MIELTVDAGLAWGVAVAAVVVVFAAGGQWWMTRTLARDLRDHMKAETKWRETNDKQWRNHLTGHAP